MRRELLAVQEVMEQKPAVRAGSWQSLDVPTIQNPRGNIAVIEGGQLAPFSIERVYYLYDVPSGAERLGHAHRELSQLLVATSGSFKLHLDNGRLRETIYLNRPKTGILIGPMVWRVIDDFSAGAVCLVLASRHYDEADYVRDYERFQELVGGQ